MTEDKVRERIVKDVKATGEYLLKDAEKLVDKAGLRTGFVVKIEFDYDNPPTLTVSQKHYMWATINARRGKE